MSVGATGVAVSGVEVILVSVVACFLCVSFNFTVTTEHKRYSVRIVRMPNKICFLTFDCYSINTENGIKCIICRGSICKLNMNPYILFRYIENKTKPTYLEAHISHISKLLHYFFCYFTFPHVARSKHINLIIK